MEHNYTIALALFDYLPVLLSAVGVILLARLYRQLQPGLGRLATIGAAMIIAGGLSKASWKLLVAAADYSIDILNYNLFIFLSAGFICLLLVAWQVQRGQAWSRAEPIAAGLVALVWVGAASLALSKPESRSWFFLLLGVTTLCSSALMLVLAWASRRYNGWASVCFVASIVVSMVLSSQAKTFDYNAASQWLKEIGNVISQGLFMLGALWYSRAAVGEKSR